MISKQVNSCFPFGLISFLKVHNLNLEYKDRLYYNMSTFKFVKAIGYSSFHHDYDIIIGNKPCPKDEQHRVDNYIEKKGPLYISFEYFIIANVDDILNVEKKVENINAKNVSCEKFINSFMNLSVTKKFFFDLDKQITMSIKSEKSKFDDFLRSLKNIKTSNSYEKQIKKRTSFNINLVTERIVTNISQFDYFHTIGDCTFVIKKRNNCNLFKEGNKYFGLIFDDEMWVQIKKQLDDVFNGVKFIVDESEFDKMIIDRKNEKPQRFVRPLI